MCLFNRMESPEITLAFGGLGVEQAKTSDRAREIFLSRLDAAHGQGKGRKYLCPG